VLDPVRGSGRNVEPTRTERELESDRRFGAGWQGTHLVRQVPHVRSFIGGVGYAPILMTELIGNSMRGADVAWVRLELVAGRIASATGEGIGVRELCASTIGRTLLEAAAIPGEPLATDALHDALGPALDAPADERRVAVAMSGGVDSAVALVRALEAGRKPVGVTLRLWTDPAGPSSDRACCSPESVIAARDTCHRLGLPHATLDLREGFRRAVVTPFVRGYARGETPNPCIRCNGGFRFAALLAFAKRIGARTLATGHYARLQEHRGRLLLARGADPAKDQSYMLARVDPRLLPRLWFPLGEQSKEETRAEARAAGLAAAGRAESQEACFLAGGDYREFLGRHGLEAAEGPVVDEEGHELGRHAGFWRFTPGQRRGLGLSTGEPVYALRGDARTNTVVVGPRESLARREIMVRTGRLFVAVDRVDAKLRYRSPAVSASVASGNRGFRLSLDEPAFGVAAGQAAVLYEGDAVVGAGLITSSR
jgi:tRNA-uridine 2-sulfurtransferase